ncbi:MAG TPA: HAMP domain-containing sensor histidine kinase, partial [Ktedonobacteraceae bacterium]|nr:HAMP domain-containing sensor histidine kinase [Ktedonobacteraceae bacterium]
DLCLDMSTVHKALQLQESLPYREFDLSIKGASRSIGLSITPVSVTNNPFCLMMARDVTAIRDANRMKANFLSMITHELRSPLNAINGYLDLALTGIAGELNEQQQEFVQRARASSEHLYALVEDLLLVSRADSGQIRLNRDITSLQEIVANAVEELELTAKDNNVAINVEVPGDFPHIYADAVRMQQVLRNLMSNALRFTPAAGNVTIASSVVHKMESEEGQNVLELQVCDTGSGIALEHQQRIFERFYQAPQGYAGRSGGQGLGLAIVKMIVELHGGTVTVESAPGQGSTFTCLIPCLLT